MLRLKRKQFRKRKERKRLERLNPLLIVGLGNPGSRYAGTRHNAGFDTADRLAGMLSVNFKKVFMKPLSTAVAEHSGRTIVIAKPLTYMNRSGEVFHYLFHRYGCSAGDAVVVCDNMDLLPGVIRLKKKGSSAGHNGLKSIMSELGTGDFARLYIGIGRASGNEDTVSHVLGKPQGDEADRYAGALDNAAAALMGLLEAPVEQVMNGINRKNC